MSIKNFVEETCVGCMDKAPDTLFCDCRHQCMCVECLASLFKAGDGNIKCPLCEDDIKKGYAVLADIEAEKEPFYVLFDQRGYDSALFPFLMAMLMVFTPKNCPVLEFVTRIKHRYAEKPGTIYPKEAEDFFDTLRYSEYAPLDSVSSIVATVLLLVDRPWAIKHGSPMVKAIRCYYYGASEPKNFHDAYKYYKRACTDLGSASAVLFVFSAGTRCNIKL